MQRRYTSVFPLPVTPWSRKRAGPPASSALRTASNAAVWSGVSSGYSSSGGNLSAVSLPPSPRCFPLIAAGRTAPSTSPIGWR